MMRGFDCLNILLLNLGHTVGARFPERTYSAGSESGPLKVSQIGKPKIEALQITTYFENVGNGH